MSVLLFLEEKDEYLPGISPSAKKSPCAFETACSIDEFSPLSCHDAEDKTRRLAPADLFQHL